jgi:hypothetical protein
LRSWRSPLLSRWIAARCCSADLKRPSGCHAGKCAISARNLFGNASIAPSFLQLRTGRALRPRAALAVPEPARETLERGRKVAAVCAEGEAEPLRRHFLLWRGVKVGELDHSAQFLVARAGEESRARVPSSSAAISREWPATSAARMVASLRSACSDATSTPSKGRQPHISSRACGEIVP